MPSFGRVRSGRAGLQTLFVVLLLAFLPPPTASAQSNASVALRTEPSTSNATSASPSPFFVLKRQDLGLAPLTEREKALFRRTSSPPYKGQKVEGAAFLVAGLLGLSAATVSTIGAVEVFKDPDWGPILGPPLVGIAVIAGGYGAWITVTSLRLLFGKDRSQSPFL